MGSPSRRSASSGSPTSGSARRPPHTSWAQRGPAERDDPTVRRSDQCGVAGQVERPSLVARDTVADSFPAGTVPLEFAVLQLDPGPPGSLGHEPNLDLAGAVRVRLELPPWADVPTEHHAVGRLVGEHTRPTALGPVDSAVVYVAADPRLEHGLRDRHREQVVFGWLEVTEPVGEHPEGVLDGRVHDD